MSTLTDTNRPDSKPQTAFVWPRVPASFFGIVLGLAGLGGTWRTAHKLWDVPASIGEALMLVAAVVWAVLVILYAGKWLNAREEAVREADDPIQCCFIGLVGVSTTLISLAALPYLRLFAIALFVVGAMFTAAFAVWRTGRLWQGGRDPAATTPILYLPTVTGGFITAIAAAALGYRDLGQLAFGAGLFSWLALESVLIQRLYTAPALPEALRPTLGIQLAPPAVCAVAYLSLTSGLPNIAVHAMLGYALLQAMVLLRLLPWIARQHFVPAYWAFSFGAAALSTAPLRLLERGDTGVIAVIAPPIFVAVNIVVFIIACGTVRLIVTGQLLPRTVGVTGPAGARDTLRGSH